MKVKSGCLGNNTGTKRVVEFGSILGDTSVYPRFGYLLGALMGSMSKALVGKFSRYIVTHYIGFW